MVLPKCKNRHLLDVVRTLLLESFVPSTFWVEALSTPIYLINRLPSRVLDFASPYYHLYHYHPNYLGMHTFCCVCFVYLPSHERHKLYAQSIKCAFMGYSISHKGYVYYNPCSNKFCISRHVVFFENHSSLLMLLLCQRYMFFLILISYILLPKDLNQGLCMNDDVQLCRFLSKTGHMSLFQLIIPQSIRLPTPFFDALPESVILLIGMVFHIHLFILL